MSNWVPIPQSLDELHPIVVHFPIALLLVAPVFIFLGMLRPRRDWRFSVSALILMLLGTAAAWIASKSGEATAQLAELTPAVSAAIDEHQKFADRTTLLFTGLTLVFMFLTIVPFVFKTLRPRWIALLHGIFLIAFLGGTLFLARTGHLGGRLVHAFGVHAMMSGETPADAAAITDNADTEEESQAGEEAQTKAP